MRRSLIRRFSALLLFAVAGCATIPDTPPADSFSRQPPVTETKRQPLPGNEVRPAIEARIPAHVPPVRVGLLLPLSGESQALGQAMLDAAILALYDHYMPLAPEQVRARVVLIPKDTGSSPVSSAAAAEQVIHQGARLVLGPVFSGGVSAAAPVTRRARVPMLSFSNNRAVAGEGVYVFGFPPEQQIARVAEYATLKDITAVGALLPNDAYGATVHETLHAILTSKGIRVEPVEFYARTPANLEAAVIRLREGYDRTPFQALFIADGGEQLKQIIAALKLQALTKDTVRFLGTGLWDEEEVSINPDMKGAWFASSPPATYAGFERRFMAAYGYKPQRLASLAYDAVTLAAMLAQSGDGAFAPTQLTRAEGFTGPANALYRFYGDGTVSRSLAVMEITPAGFRMLDAAPKQF